MPKSTGTTAAPVIDCSAPRHEITRRLSDKILTAFNHAYAIGETEIADKLRDVLAHNEKSSRVEVEQRGNFDPIGRADLWVAFVEARNRYKKVCDIRKPRPGSADKALDTMKDAYRRWSTD
jgi:hypothetical protein